MPEAATTGSAADTGGAADLAPQQVVERFLASIGDLDVAMQYIADDIVYENIGAFPLTEARFWVCGKFEVRDGKIVHWRDYFDNGNVLAGLPRGATKAALAKAARR
jgi:limonene-1,2-epoxide hydrolase